MLKNLFSVQRNNFRHALALVATMVLATTVAYLTLSPPQPSDLNGFLSDKAYHFIAFAALVLPTAVFYARSLILVLPAAVMFGGLIELIQPYVGRSRETADFIADLLGIGCGFAVGLAIRAIYRKRARLKIPQTP